MKIRVLSDLHIDVNEMYAAHKNEQFNKALANNDVFTIVAGDTAGSPEIAIDWIKQHISKGLIIAGNHIVYDSNGQPVQALKQQMAQAFPKDGPITFLDQMTGIMSKEIDGILFIGTTLYTDYALYPDISVEWAMHKGFRGLNDFYTGYTKDKDTVRRLMPTDYRRWFIESAKEITRLVEANPDKEVVLITHHCPSEKCCTFRDEILNTSYASNLEGFIQTHPNIRLWIAGHAHNRKEFKVGNCLVLMNPRGYEHEGECYGFTPNVFVDTKNWTVQREKVENDFKKWLKQAMKQSPFDLYHS